MKKSTKILKGLILGCVITGLIPRDANTQSAPLSPKLLSELSFRCIGTALAQAPQ